MKIRLSKMLLPVLGVLVLAGCHKLEAVTTITPQGSGELDMGVGFSPEERANLEKQNNNPQDFCNVSQSASNVTVIEQRRGDETWCITTTHFETLEELRNLYEKREGIKINRLEIIDGKFYYDLDIDTLSEPSSFSTLTDIKWSVVLPGAPISHNADKVDQNTLTWTPAPKSGAINLRAESELPRGFNFPSCGTVIIGLGAVLLHLRRRGKNSPLR